MIGLLLQIHWLAVNGRTEVLHDLFAFVPDVDVEVWLYKRERERGKRREEYEEGRATACIILLRLWILEQETY